MSKETCSKPTNGEYYATQWPGTPYAEDECLPPFRCRAHDEDEPCQPLLPRRERNHRQAAPPPLDSVLQAIIGRAAEHRV